MELLKILPVYKYIQYCILLLYILVPNQRCHMSVMIYTKNSHFMEMGILRTVDSNKCTCIWVNLINRVLILRNVPSQTDVVRKPTLWATYGCRQVCVIEGIRTMGSSLVSTPKASMSPFTGKCYMLWVP